MNVWIWSFQRQMYDVLFCSVFSVFLLFVLFSGVHFSALFVWYCIWCLLYVWSVKSQTIFTLYLVVCRIWINSIFFILFFLLVFTCGTCFVFKSIANPKSLWKWYEGCWIEKRGNCLLYFSVFCFRFLIEI